MRWTAKRPKGIAPRRSDAKSSAAAGAVTMHTVAKMAGVSAMTVSRALKSDAAVSKETRDRVLEIVRQVGYVPDASARVFATRRSGFVASLVPSLNNSNFADTVHGMSEVFDVAGVQMLLGDTEYSLSREEDLIRAFLQRRPEAIILTGGVHSEANAGPARQRRCSDRRNLGLARASARRRRRILQQGGRRGDGPLSLRARSAADRVHRRQDELRHPRRGAARRVQAGDPVVAPAKRPNHSCRQTAGDNGAGRGSVGGDVEPMARRRRDHVRLRPLGVRRAGGVPTARNRRSRAVSPSPVLATSTSRAVAIRG